jgi:hypothetical protein
MISDHLRIQPGQQALTPAQEAEARRFAEERIQAQLSTEPVDEQQAEAFLRQAYAVAGLVPPQHIQWVDGPLQLGGVPLFPGSVNSVKSSDWDRFRESVWTNLSASTGNSFLYSIQRIFASIDASVWRSIGLSVEESIWRSYGLSDWDLVMASVRAYQAASGLAVYRFFDLYLAPNDCHALTLFNEMVSGYWLGEEVALVVRRPRLLSRDGRGRPHSATGKCVEYYDGWGFYAWHGVLVSEQVILSPERLARDDFLTEPNVEVRRVIQERMGGRFVPELGGVVIDSGPRGTLYEVRLPADDPERVARYVQVQDAAPRRQYFVRVPPTIQTAAEAVAWTFGVSVEAYHPAQET